MAFAKTHIVLFALLLSSISVSPALCQVQDRDGRSGDSIPVQELLIMDTLRLEIKGPSNDVAFYMNGLVFLSNSKFHQNMLPDHIAFGQITSFFAPLEYISLESARPLFSNDPFPYAPGGTCFSRDYQTVYFTKQVEIPGKRNPEKIFEMAIIDGKATTYNQLSFTAGPTRYMHPAISANNEFLILASDLYPSNGGLDLFIVRKGLNGWGTPVNLGPDINTGGHEWYPFLDQHNNLYFSSSGHMGYGGYDIYVCLFDGEGWGKPRNLTDLVNSGKDELGFSIHPARKMAIYSTNTEEEGQVEEILKLELNKSAFVLAGIDSKNQDISLLIEDMVGSGYTAADLGTSGQADRPSGFILTALPLLDDEEAKEVEEPAITAIEDTPEPEPEVQVEEPVLIVEETETEPEIQDAPPLTEMEEAAAVTALATAEDLPLEEDEPEDEPAVDEIVFRVQILSSSRANSNPKVTIDGSQYNTWEYRYKGAYRITVGEFSSVQEASAFNKKCRASGFNQSFVAAFRGNERETDPAVFKR